MMTRISIKQTADHALVLRAVLCGLSLEEFDAALRERDGHFYAFLAKSKVLRGREKVGNDLQFAQWFIGVSDFLGHRFSYLVASNRPQKSE